MGIAIQIMCCAMCCGVTLGAHLFSDPAVAQEKPQRPCKVNEERLCAEVPYGHGRVRACLESREDKLAPECRAALAGGPQMTPIEIPPEFAANNIRLNGWLARPKDTPRYGAVVILHGCNGLDSSGWMHALQWAHWFNKQGLAALVLDSFSPRGLTNICGAGARLPAHERVQDLYAATRYLTSTPDIETDKIAAVGFSHGGWTVVEAAFEVGFEVGHGKFAALIAIYPFCERAGLGKISAPLLILAGGQDDWTPSKSCARLASRNGTGAPDEVRVKIYPEARHGFDVDRPPRHYLGHILEYDKEAADDAHAQIAQFLEERLGKRARGPTDQPQ